MQVNSAPDLLLALPSSCTLNIKETLRCWCVIAVRIAYNDFAHFQTLIAFDGPYAFGALAVYVLIA